MLIVCKIYVADVKEGILDEPELYNNVLLVPFTDKLFAYTLLLAEIIIKVIVKVRKDELFVLILVKAHVKLVADGEGIRKIAEEE